VREKVNEMFLDPARPGVPFRRRMKMARHDADPDSDAIFGGGEVFEPAGWG